MGHSEEDAVHKKTHKMKMQNQLVILVLFNLKSSIDLDIKRYLLYLSNTPLKGQGLTDIECSKHHFPPLPFFKSTEKFIIMP